MEVQSYGDFSCGQSSRPPPPEIVHVMLSTLLYFMNCLRNQLRTIYFWSSSLEDIF